MLSDDGQSILYFRCNYTKISVYIVVRSKRESKPKC